MAAHRFRMIDKNGDVGIQFLSLDNDADAKRHADTTLGEYDCERVEVWLGDNPICAAIKAPVLIDDREVWRAALLMVKRYGDDAMLEAIGARNQACGERHNPQSPAARRGRPGRRRDVTSDPERD